LTSCSTAAIVRDRYGEPLVDEPVVDEPTVCDSCGAIVDRELEPGRFRHDACPPPPLPAAAVDAIKRARALR
jgi:hypothetical protein